MKTLLLIVAAFFALNSLNSHAEEIVVGVKTAEPFASQTTHGQWTGVSIDLLDHLAEQNGFTYRLVDLKDVGTLIWKTSKNEVDMTRASNNMAKAKAKEQRAKASADRAAQAAGLKSSSGGLSSALESMNRQAQDATDSADAASRKADLLGDKKVEENDAVAAAMAAVSGAALKATSAADRLAALR